MSARGRLGADVTICVPAWQAEAFIDRTLTCAREQTHRAIRILVSVDACADDTVALCRRHAAADARIEVIVQPERLGWSRNANSLLDLVDTEFFFLYFHDDIIAPTYVAQLLRTLESHSGAMSTHCDLERFGTQTAIDRGNDYIGSACHRLLAFLVGPVKGTPLRSLTRTVMLDRGLRFPVIGTDGFWRCHPFLLTLLAGGPALRHPEVLYRRWFRAGSLTTSWAPRDAAELIDGQRQSAERCLAIIDGLTSSEDEKELVRYALRIFMMTWTRQSEMAMSDGRLIAPEEIAPLFASRDVPPLASAPADVQGWVDESRAVLESLEASLQSRATLA